MLRTYLYIAALLLLTTAIFFCACNNAPTNNDQTVVQQDTTHEEIEEDVSPPVEIIQNFSDPVEFATILKNANIAYDPSLLFDNPNINKKLDNETQAMLLGVTAADCMYKLIYEQDITKEKKVISQLVQELKIDKYWIFENIRINDVNLDSICYLAYIGAEAMLKNKKNESTTFLMAWGYWVEFIYIALKKSEIKEIRDIAGAQKIFTHEFFAANKHYQITMIEKYAPKLQRVYEPVEISIVEPDLEVKDVNNACGGAMQSVIQTPQTVIDSALVIITDIRNDLCWRLTISLYNENNTSCYGYRNMGY